MGLLAAIFSFTSLGLIPPSDRAGLSMSPPDGWVEDATLAPPDLSQTPQSRATEWRVWRGPPPEPLLVAACFETGTEVWAPEAGPLVLDKMAQFAASTAIRAARPGVHASRALFGFVRTGEGHVLTSCFAMCTNEADAACAASLDSARMQGPLVEAPRPTFGVRLLLSAVHHPARAAGAIGGIVCLGFAGAVATRKRPRRKQRP